MILTQSSSHTFRRSHFQERSHTQTRPSRLGSIVFDGLVLNSIMLALIVFTGLSYLFVINQSSVSGFKMEELQRNIETSQRELRQLELSRAQLQSLASIEAAGERLQMVAANDVHFLPAVGTVVASR
ncbi:MAG: hypothetical protein WC289_03560 [Patescibacteria group bacterium]|jgi:hypothetical protein